MMRRRLRNYPKLKNIGVNSTKILARKILKNNIIQFTESEKFQKEVNDYGLRDCIRVVGNIQFDFVDVKFDSISICHPDDEFDYYYGEKIAKMKVAEFAASQAINQFVDAISNIETDGGNYMAKLLFNVDNNFNVSVVEAYHIVYLVLRGFTIGEAYQFVKSGRFVKNLQRVWDYREKLAVQ